MISFPKPIRGSALLASRDRRAQRIAHEQKEMQAALRRDERKCRIQPCQYASRKLPIDPAHVFGHRGSGGNPDGTRTTRSLIAAVCRVHHGLIDAGAIVVKALTDDGTDGPLVFYQRVDAGRMHCIAVETRRGVSTPRS